MTHNYNTVISFKATEYIPCNCYIKEVGNGLIAMSDDSNLSIGFSLEEGMEGKLVKVQTNVSNIKMTKITSTLRGVK